MIRLFIVAAILVCLNVLAYNFNYSLDLTQEKRFTLSPKTKTFLRNMKDVAVVDVYLKGEFPAGFKKLQQATRERLQSFKEYGGNHIVFNFVDPTEGKSRDEKDKITNDLMQQGITGVDIHQTNESGSSQQIIFPWAVVHYYGKQMAVNLLENDFGMTAQQKLNTSEALLEYKFVSALNKLTRPDKPRVAYIGGNNEALGLATFDALATAGHLYHLDTIDIRSGIEIPPVYDAIIINKPLLPFDDKEKFKIDQYIMHGGKVLWLVESLNTSMDSFKVSQQFIAMEYGLNLDDMLFKYGVRINNDLVEDLQCEQIPLQAQGRVNSNGEPELELKDWMFFPILNPTSSHPIVNNMGPIIGKFANSIDTIADPNIKKTILLQSSKYSRVESSPVRVNLAITQFPMREDMFKSPYHAVAVLVEGKFTSAFQNRLPPSFLQLLRDSIKRPFKNSCDSPGSMIIISDADIIANDFSSNGPYQMGFYKYSQAKYANRTFYLNCLEYLTDRSGLLEARSKDMKLRLLDSGRVKNEILQWRIINIGVPIGLVLVFASCFIFFRKRRYEKAA